jgi:plasmid maintenance system antidote protein VapI
MFNPPHPGKVLREFLGEMDVTSAAKKLHILEHFRFTS